MNVDDIKKVIQQNYYFCSLSPQQFEWLEREIIPNIEVVEYRLGDEIISSGEIVDGFYIIVSGTVRLVTPTDSKSITLSVLGSGDHFGEWGLLLNRPSEIIARASSDLTLLKVTRNEFGHLLKKFSFLQDKLQVSIQEQAEFRFFRNLEIFADLKLSEVHKYQQESKLIELQTGEFLFSSGQIVDAIYIVCSGNIRLVEKQVDDPTLAIIKAGDICGETAMLSEAQTYPISAIATTKTRVLCLDRQVYASLFSYPKVRQKLDKIINNRQLQYQAILDDRKQDRLQNQFLNSLNFQTVKLEKKFLHTSSFTFATVENPLLTGIACLATINLQHQRQFNLQPIIEKKIAQAQPQPDTLISLSRQAEAFGYLTRFLYLNNERLGQIADFPALIEYDGGICLLLSVAKTTVTLVNPCTGIIISNREEFIAKWNRRLLTLRVVPNLGNIGQKNSDAFRQFLTLLKPYWQTLAWVIVISFAAQIMGLAEPLFSQIIIDSVLEQVDYSLLLLILVGMLLTTGFQLVGSSLQEILLAQAMKRISISFLLRFFQHILSLPKKVFAQWQVGDFTVRLGENEALLALVSQSGFSIVINSVTSLFYLVILLNKNAKLTGVALIFVVAYGLVLIISTPLLRANDRRVFECHRRSESHLIATLTGIETVKAIARENLFFQQGMDLLVASHLAEFKGALLGFNIGLIGGVINQASTICILGYGASLTFPVAPNQQPALTIGELVAFNALLGLLLGSLQSLIGIWDELQQIKISFERINDVLALPVEAQDPTAIMPTITGRIRLENVYFRYEEGKQDVLQNINLEIFPGETVAIVGKSGSGKTTLVNLLVKLFEPTQGKIYIDNIDISTIELSSYRRQLGVVEQQPYLFNGTVRENVAKADPTANLETLSRAAESAGADQFIKSLPLQYDTQIGERGMTLSGGQKQRLIIARALLTNPRILLLDEPTASLDSDSERLILKNLNKQTVNRTSLIVAHRLSTVLHADKIVVIDRGQILEVGTHTQLLKQEGFYANLYRQTKSSRLVSH
jgi:ABC-type bacteriocin/lantibiotic exporter with double-glycine peptidase domain/CRP-like cAMP-binding protein